MEGVSEVAGGKEGGLQRQWTLALHKARRRSDATVAD